jgi:hypothetical protein
MLICFIIISYFCRFIHIYNFLIYLLIISKFLCVVYLKLFSRYLSLSSTVNIPLSQNSFCEISIPISLNISLEFCYHQL